MKFRKKPVVIEAFQWTLKTAAELNDALNDKETSVPDWFVKACHEMQVKKDIQSFGLIIKTLEGDHLANTGDWIIQGVKGELYPCKPDIFEMTYSKDEEEKEIIAEHKGYVIRRIPYTKSWMAIPKHVTAFYHPQEEWENEDQALGNMKILIDENENIKNG